MFLALQVALPDEPPSAPVAPGVAILVWICEGGIFSVRLLISRFHHREHRGHREEGREKKRKGSKGFISNSEISTLFSVPSVLSVVKF